MELRRVGMDDIELIIKLRLDFLDIVTADITAEQRDQIAAQMRGYLPGNIADGTFSGVVAEENGEVMSTAYFVAADMPANTAFINGKTGTLINVLTYPQYRRRGIAAEVISMIIDDARSSGILCIDLAATSDGKPLYETLGFRESSSHTAMRLTLD